MVSLKDKERKVLEFMISYFNEYKNIPFMMEICRATGLARSTVLSVQQKLCKLGYIDRFLVGKRMIIIILWKP